MGVVFTAKVPEWVMDKTRVVVAKVCIITGREYHSGGVIAFWRFRLFGNHLSITFNQSAIDFLNPRHCRGYGIIDYKEAAILLNAIDSHLKFQHAFWLFGMGNSEQVFPFLLRISWRRCVNFRSLRVSVHG